MIRGNSHDTGIAFANFSSSSASTGGITASGIAGGIASGNGGPLTIPQVCASQSVPGGPLTRGTSHDGSSMMKPPTATMKRIHSAINLPAHSVPVKKYVTLLLVNTSFHSFHRILYFYSCDIVSITFLMYVPCSYTSPSTLLHSLHYRRYTTLH